MQFPVDNWYRNQSVRSHDLSMVTHPYIWQLVVVIDVTDRHFQKLSRPPFYVLLFDGELHGSIHSCSFGRRKAVLKQPHASSGPPFMTRGYRGGVGTMHIIATSSAPRHRCSFIGRGAVSFSSSSQQPAASIQQSARQAGHLLEGLGGGLGALLADDGRAREGWLRERRRGRRR